MKIIYVLLLLGLLVSCDEHFEEKEVYGYYTPVDYKNNFDTIQLQSQGVYYRKVYDMNKKLLLEIKGKWKLEGNTVVHFESFYLNLDDDLLKFPNNVSDTTGGWRGSLENRNNTTHFCVGHHQGKNCYRKID